jgi:1-acyl-sn-glycerol-3-phosphate acyltransferase
MNSSKIPVSIHNYQAVYDWYESYRQPRHVTKLAYRALNMYYKPDVHYVDGAEDEFYDFRSNDVPQIFVLNHLTNHSDQFVASAIAHQMTPEDVGRTRVLAKDELFRGTQRHFVDMMGAVPTFRKKDHLSQQLFQEYDEDGQLIVPPDQAKLLENATDALIACTGNIVASGENMAVFGEGTHNKVDPLKVQKLRPGFARIALHAYNKFASPMITPIGLSFGLNLDQLQPRRAVAVINPSIALNGTSTVESLIEETANSLQSAVDLANDIHSSRKFK